MYTRTVLPFLVCLFLLPRFTAAQSAPRDTAEVNRVIDSLLQVSGTLTKQKQYDQALEVNAEAERLALAYLGRESVGYGKVCHSNGVVAFNKDNLTNAEQWWLEAKEIWEKVSGKEHPSYAATLNNLALLYKNMGNYEKSEALFLESIAIAESLTGKESVNYVKGLGNLAVLYNKTGQFDKSETLSLECLQIKKKIIGMENSSYAGTLINLAILYRDMGQYDKSEDFFLEAKEIFEVRLNNRTHTFYLICLKDLGDLYRIIGQFEMAEKLLIESLTIQEKTLGTETSDYANGLNSLANLYKEMGYYEKAASIFEESININKKLFGEDHLAYAVGLNNLSNLYLAIGVFNKAEQMYQEAKTLYEKVLGKGHPHNAIVLNNLANLYVDIGKYKDSELLYYAAKSIQEKHLGIDHLDYAQTLNNIGILYNKMGESKLSEQFLDEAKIIREKILNKEHPTYAASLFNLANLYFNIDEYFEADSLYVRAKDISKIALGKQHPNYAIIIKNQLILYELQSRHPVSDSLLAEFHPLQQTLQSKAITHLSERDLTAYAATFQSDGDELASFAYNRMAKGHSTTLLPALYYNHQLFQKGFLLGAASRVGTLAAATPESIETFNRLKGYRRRLAAEYAKPIAERQNVPELEARADSLEKVLVRTVAGFGEALRQVNWQEVQTQLRPGEAAVEFVHYRYYDQKARATDSTLYAALVLLPADTAPRFVPLCEARQVEEAVQKAGADELRFQNLYNALDRPSSPLYPLVWQPLEAHLQGVKTVYYAPSGLLHRLQLGAIQPTKRETLSDRYRLVALGSTRQLVVPPAVSPASNTAAVFGGIRYEMDSTKIAAVNLTYADSSGALADVFRGSGGFVYTDSTLRGGSWNYLPATEAEATNISGLLKKHGFRTDTRLGFAATEESVQYLGNGKSPSPRVLHIATHGFFFPDPKATGTGRQAMDNEPTFKISDNPLIRSGLLLAGAEHGWKTGKPLREGMEDGILTAYEISQMNLRNTELVVLSACETGLGDIQGNEGVYGLQRAFKVAGARYLLMSLWQVPDKATQGFMEAFYAHWLDKGMSIPDAFRAAQGVARAGNSNPLYWAGFVLVE